MSKSHLVSPVRFLALWIAGLAIIVSACQSPAAPSEPAAPTPVPTLANPCVAQAQQQVYISRQEGYCFVYPSRFKLIEDVQGQPEVRGPALDKNAEPLLAALETDIQKVSATANLKNVVSSYLVQFAQNKGAASIQRQPMSLGGEPAERIEVLPVGAGSRDVMAIHNGRLYHLMFTPSVRDYPQAANDVEELFQTVVNTFSFLP